MFYQLAGVDAGLAEKLLCFYILRIPLSACGTLCAPLSKENLQPYISHFHWARVAINGNPQIHKKVRTQWEVVLFSWTGCSSSQRHFEPPSSLLAAEMWLPTRDCRLARRRWNWVGSSRLSCQADRLPGTRRPVSHERGSIRRQWLAGGGWVQTLVTRCGQSADPAAQSRHWCWASGWVRTLRLLRAIRA